MFPSWLMHALDGYDLGDWEPSDTARVRAMVAGLVVALGGVVDARRREGRRHDLVALLTLSVLCALAGCRGDRPGWRWARRLPLAIRVGVGLRAGRVPARSTWAAALGRVDGTGLDVAVGAFVQDLAALARQGLADAARPGRAALVHLACDGKAQRGARERTAGAQCPMLVVVYEPALGAVLAQDAVEPGKGKGAELAAAERALEQIGVIAGMVVSLDALYCTAATAEYLTGRGAHYVIGLKGNRKKLSRLAKDLPWDEIKVAFRDNGTGHGRVETREYKIVQVPDGFTLPGARQIVQVTRTRKKQGRPGPGKKRVFYYVTSLDARQADPARVAEVIRKHWGVEVLHWVRDAVLGEDAHTARTGALPRVWAILRNLAITLLRLAGHIRYKEAFEDNNHDPWTALALLT